MLFLLSVPEPGFLPLLIVNPSLTTSDIETMAKRGALIQITDISTLLPPRYRCRREFVTACIDQPTSLMEFL